MTEHYTCFIVCVSIPNKEAATIASAFRNHVLAVFEAPVECLVDGGTEFEGAFEDLCRQCLIDRRATSPDSPEGNELTERVVRTIKFCFKKLALEKGPVYEWDELLWSLVPSRSPREWHLLRSYSRRQEATVPPNLRAQPNLDFEAEEEYTLAEDLLRRARIVKKTYGARWVPPGGGPASGHAAVRR
ncbi:hypothetical protein CYMTET_34240 [Cymbomonas tetramitiformis]|uniref:Integrase catalytic domain-containing protein n=1 Tax=Cymbomonas tetramitiformis TaxID=36881 RepID=A0AAE0KQ50_9CHLO|nr:hypothetical protein CYMTET_34240 [Cymbomonas tetramitiformis]